MQAIFRCTFRTKQDAILARCSNHDLKDLVQTGHVPGFCGVEIGQESDRIIAEQLCSELDCVLWWILDLSLSDRTESGLETAYLVWRHLSFAMSLHVVSIWSNQRGHANVSAHDDVFGVDETGTETSASALQLKA